MTDGRIKLAIGIPAYGGQINSAHSRMWATVGASIGFSPNRFALVSFNMIDLNPVDKARNHLVGLAQALGADWFLSVDADTWVVDIDDSETAGFQLLRMISDADRAGATLVSAPVVHRVTGDIPKTIAVYDVVDSGPEYRAHGGLVHKPYAMSQLPRSLMEVGAVGAACFAINLHRVREYGLEYKFGTDGLSEDLDMCRQIRVSREALRAAANGVWSAEHDPEELRGTSIFVDGRVRTAHMSRPCALLTSELQT